MDDPVAGHDIGGGDRCAVHHDRITDGERQGMTAHGIGRHAVRDIGCWNCTCNHVRKENFSQGFLTLSSVKGSEVDAGVGKGLVRWCKHRERTFALQRFKQFGLNNGRDKGIVHARALRRTWDVVGVRNGRQDRVDNVDDAVAGHDVGDGDRRPVHRDRFTNGERQGVTADRLSGHAVRNIASRNGSGHNVRQENLRKGDNAVGRVQGSEVDAGFHERLVGWSKDRERTFALQGFQEIGLDNSCDQ